MMALLKYQKKIFLGYDGPFSSRYQKNFFFGKGKIFGDGAIGTPMTHPKYNFFIGGAKFFKG